MSTDPTIWLDKYGDLLYRMAYIRLRDRVASEDVVQETLLAALRGAPSFRGDSSERTWLVGILKHKIYDYIRHTFRDKPHPDDQVLSASDDRGFRSDGEWSKPNLPSDWGFEPHALLERAEFWAAFEHCLSLLPRRMASMFALYVIDEIPSEDLCNDFNVTPTNFRVLLYRSRKQLRECLEENWARKGNQQ